MCSSPAAQPDPGFLTVQLTAPQGTDDIGAMLVVEGLGIDSVRSPGFDLFQSETISPRQIIVAGALSTGPIVQFQVPDRNDFTRCTGCVYFRSLERTTRSGTCQQYRAEILR